MKEAIQYLRSHDYDVTDDGIITTDLPDGIEGLALVDTLEDKFNCTIIGNEIKEIE